MSTAAERAVARAIATMYGHIGNKLTVDDLARSALFSKFHFSRFFLRITGISPARYLSAVRIETAKRLLVTTPSSVADISHQVGYNSVGTFSRRFHGSVGVPPSVYRRERGALTWAPPDSWTVDDRRSAVIRGTVTMPADAVPAPVFVGLFRSPILEGPLARFAVLDGAGAYLLNRVPLGTWHLLAHTLPGSDTDRPALIGARGPITIRPEVTARTLDIRLRQRRAIDPPLLIALPEYGPSGADLRAAERWTS